MTCESRKHRNGLLAGATVLVLSMPSHAQSDRCDRYSIRNVSVGSTLGDVRARLGREGVVWSLYVGGVETNAVEYELTDSLVHIEFDHRIGKWPEARVALVKSSMRSVSQAASDLVDRWGPPSSGRTEVGATTEHGSTIWVVPSCGLIATAYRQGDSSSSGRNGAVVQIERFTATRHDAALPEAALPEVAAIEAPPDTLPERIRYVAPRYPRKLRRSGVTGRVALMVTIRPEGSVGNLRLTDVVPRGRGFESAAIVAVQQWLYKPATRRGIPFAVAIPVVVEFK